MRLFIIIKMMKRNSFLKDLIQILITSLVIVFVLVKFFIMPVEVKGRSMEPNLYEGEFGFSSIISKNIEIHRFDTVVVDIESKLIVKRVIGMPNETIEYKDNVLYVNEEVVEENFAKQGDTEDLKIRLGENEYYCLGDNRSISIDSRVRGAFKLEQLKATHVFIIKPFKEFGLER